MGTDHTTNTPAAVEFQRALLFSFTTRQDHGGNVAAAFIEFTGEPDINGHWATLGNAAVADMIGNAAVMAAYARHNQNGGMLGELPDAILTTENAPLVDAAQILMDTVKIQSPDPSGERVYDRTVLDAECVRLVEEIDTPDAVALFAILTMTVFPTQAGEG